MSEEFQNRDMNEEDNEAYEDEYSHLNSSRIGQPTKAMEHCEDPVMSAKLNATLAEEQLALMQKRMNSLKSQMAPVVVPLGTSVSTEASSPQQARPYQSSGQASQNSGQKPTYTQTEYVKPTSIRINEIEDAKYSIKQYTDKSIILRAGPSVPDNFFKDYSTVLSSPPLNGKFIYTPRDGGKPGWCFPNYLYSQVLDVTRAIAGGQLAPTKTTVQNYLPASVTSVPQIPTVSAIPAIQATPKNVQTITIPKPVVGEYMELHLPGNAPILIQIVQVGTSNLKNVEIVTSARAKLGDGRLIEMTLNGYVWQIPGFTTAHEILNKN